MLCGANITGALVKDRRHCTFESRVATTDHHLARTLFKLMSTKKTNLCVAADVTTSQELLTLADKVCFSQDISGSGRGSL